MIQFQKNNYNDPMGGSLRCELIAGASYVKQKGVKNDNKKTISQNQADLQGYF
jgi:hypothetical protein